MGDVRVDADWHGREMHLTLPEEPDRIIVSLGTEGAEAVSYVTERKKPDAEDMLRVLAEMHCAMGAMDTVADWFDQRPAQVLRRYRQFLANAAEEVETWICERGD